MRKNKLYSNIKIYSPENKLMFLASEKRFLFYDRKGLLEKIGNNEYRLKFNPNGLGNNERNIQLLIARENKCVVCGESDELLLTRHHIIPSRFRQFFPLELKSHDNRFVVFCCIDCHSAYTKNEYKFVNILAKELNLEIYENFYKNYFKVKRKIIGIANTLLYHYEQLPIDVRNNMNNEFKETTGLDVSEENLLKIGSRKFKQKYEDKNYNKLIIDNTNNLFNFQTRWLLHFIETMKPKYLPIDLEIYLKNK